MTNHSYWLMKRIVPADFYERFLIGDGCWEWQGLRYKNGYGKFFISGKYHLAHRWMYKEYYGDPGTECVLHKCDNPCCCRPDHLMLGDQTENMRQRWERTGYRRT